MSYDTEELIGAGRQQLGRRRHGQNRGGPRHGLHSGRKLSSSSLQLVLLALLEKRPSHGYELIKSLEELSDGYYIPSPGMVYPSLTYLEEIGFLSVEPDGVKKRYRLSSTGLDHLNQNRSEAKWTLDNLAQIGSRMEDARRALTGEGEVNASKDEELVGAWRELKGFLRAFEPSNLEDRTRASRILRGASAELRGETADQASPIDPEALLSVIAARRSMGLSRLSAQSVDRRLIERMVEAANWAPSHEDTEPWRFTVFMGEGREQLFQIFEAAQRDDAAHGKPVRGDSGGARKRAFAAPVWIAIGMQPKLREDGSMLMAVEEEIMAVASAVQNLHLMAQASGLAGMWHSKGTSVHPAVARGLGLEPPGRLLGFFMCGWPSGEWLSSSRRPISEKTAWVEEAR